MHPKVLISFHPTSAPTSRFTSTFIRKLWPLSYLLTTVTKYNPSSPQFLISTATLFFARATTLTLESIPYYSVKPLHFFRQCSTSLNPTPRFMLSTCPKQPSRSTTSFDGYILWAIDRRTLMSQRHASFSALPKSLTFLVPYRRYALKSSGWRTRIRIPSVNG